MAIVKDDSSTDTSLVLKIDNGDLEAIKTALDKYGFVNEEALLRYALVALLKSERNMLYIRENGEIVSLRPDASLIKESPKE